MFTKNADTGAAKKQKKPQTWEDRNVWKTAKRLGVADELQKAGSDVYKDFKEGVKNARNVVTFKNLDTDSPNILKYTEALVKKSLAAPLKDETPWVQAVEDSKVALSSDDVKEYQSPPLKSYLQLRSAKDTALESVSDNEREPTKQSIFDFFQSEGTGDGATVAEDEAARQERLERFEQYMKENRFFLPKMFPFLSQWPSEAQDSEGTVGQDLWDFGRNAPQGYQESSETSDINAYYDYDKDIENSPKSMWLNVSGGFSVMGYDLLAELLLHSLQNEPSNLYFGQNSEVANKIQSDTQFQEYLDKVIENHQGEQEFEEKFDKFTFDNKDLFFAIHGVTASDSKIKGVLQQAGSYRLEVTIADVYDFDTLDETENMKEAILNVGLKMAVANQNTGIIKPYDILIEFDTIK